MESAMILIETKEEAYICNSMHFDYDTIHKWQTIVAITAEMDEVNIPLFEVRSIKPYLSEPIAVISLN